MMINNIIVLIIIIIFVVDNHCHAYDNQHHNDNHYRETPKLVPRRLPMPETGADSDVGPPSCPN